MNNRRFLEISILSAALFLVGCDNQQQTSQPASESLAVEPVAVTASDSLYRAAGQGTTPGDWDAYGADIGSTKYTPLAQIDADNIDNLEIIWRRPALDEYYLNINPQQRYSNTWNAAPVVKNGVAYVTNGVGLVEAFDPGTGETIWLQEPPGGAEGLPGAPTRGVAYWSDGDDERIIVQRGTYLYALNAGNGELYPDFGIEGRVDLQFMPPEFERYRWGGVPMVVRDIIVLGQSMSDTFDAKEAYRGDVHAFNVRTGEHLWTFHTIPQEGEFVTDTWQDRSWSYTGHAPVWALFSADEDLGMVYMPISSSTNDMYGGHRIGDNLFSQSIVAVDVETGERIWHFQTVHHGLWDYDPPAAPILMDITVDGREIKAVTQLTNRLLPLSSIVKPANRCGKLKNARFRNQLCRERSLPRHNRSQPNQHHSTDWERLKII